MPTRTGTLVVKLDSEEGAKIRKALAAQQRVKLLGLLAARAMNVNEIAAALGISQPTASIHVQVLEDAGLVESEHVPSGRGSEKRCLVTFDKLTFESDLAPTATDENVHEIAMPIGLFTAVSIIPTCGLASDSRIIGFLDNPQSFLIPERAEAQILWFSGGWVEYAFGCDLPPTAELVGIDVVAELCSEAPNYDNEWPSDITVWINGVEVGTWACTGDFGGRRGRLNPVWWSDSLTQFGALKGWSVDQSGSSIDGTPAGPVRLRDLGIGLQQTITVRVGNKPDARHLGGVNLFGRHFGNYPQDLILRLRYRLKTVGQVAEAVEALLGSGQPERGSPQVRKGRPRRK